MTQNDKNFCLLRLISLESLFIVHMHKRKYLLIFFKFLIFGTNSGVYSGKMANSGKIVVKWQKMTQNDRKLCVLHPYLRKRTPYDRDFWYTCIK